MSSNRGLWRVCRAEEVGEIGNVKVSYVFIFRAREWKGGNDVKGVPLHYV
jgi:hypothetical protein